MNLDKSEFYVYVKIKTIILMAKYFYEDSVFNFESKYCLLILLTNLVVILSIQNSSKLKL